MIDPTLRRAITRSLPPVQGALFKWLPLNRDISIVKLWRRMPPPKDGRKRVPHREKHMRVGSAIYRINVKLRPHGLYIRPGLKRGTYRLTLRPRG